MIKQRYTMAGITIGWHIDDSCAELFSQFVEKFFYCEPTTAVPVCHIEVRSGILHDETGWQRCTKEVVSRIYMMERGDNLRLLVGTEATCELNLLAGTGVLAITPAFWNLPKKRQQEWPLLAIVHLLRERGIYPLHASSVARNDKGILIAGHSGAGKSTLGLGLIQSGWRQITDDVTLFSVADVPPVLWGLARGAVQAKKPLSDAEEGLLCDGKYWYEPDRLYPGEHGKPAQLAACIFPQRDAGMPSRLSRLDRLTTLTRLMEFSGDVFVDRMWAEKQLQVIKQVAEQVPGFALHAGEDLLANPEIVVELLAHEGITFDE